MEGAKSIDIMNTNIIEGNPTKKFFIEMITRDISIEDAIIDLLDNSIDGANRINPNDYSGLEIRLVVNGNGFSIEDNCGGFSLETAQKYAFRFGRPEEAPVLHNSIGRFGIGMKRSLFKMGKIFVIETQSQNDHFKIEVNVDEWSKKEKLIYAEDGTEHSIDDWSFNYQIIDEEKLDFDGTKITITSLNKEVKDLFADSSFIRELADDIQRLLNFSLLKGLKIFLNGIELYGKRIELLMSDNVLPYYTDGVVNNVKYRVVAGLGEIGEPKDSGWYIFCNDRLVMEADTSSITGWGLTPNPKWHIDYVMFRGFLFLDSEETMNLPLTTTKKGIDATSEVYKAMLPLMQNAMVNVLDFLKKIPLMRDQANHYRQMLCDTIDKVAVVEIKNHDFSGQIQKKFYQPELDLDMISQKKNTVRIAYDVNKDMALEARKYAEVGSFKELGEVTFDYYLQMEGLKHE